MRKLLKKVLEYHIFFITESPKFVVMDLKHRLYYPIAYIKFMWYFLKGELCLRNFL